MCPAMAKRVAFQGERSMGTILAFRRDDEAAITVAAPASGSLGEIIIFPGVRIERGLWRDKPAETGAPSRRRAQGRRKK
jgi:hypothetical protein